MDVNISGNVEDLSVDIVQQNGGACFDGGTDVTLSFGDDSVCFSLFEENSDKVVKSLISKLKEALKRDKLSREQPQESTHIKKRF